jgi:nicotinamidase/pyrazinamidase
VATALLIVDVQNDFMPGGALAVPDGDQVIGPINHLIASGEFDVIIATRDRHPADHRSFAAEGGPWPSHCVADTPGAELDDRLDCGRIDAVVDKGTEREADGYSAFDSGELGALLREEQVTAVTVVGVATDYCVRRTALDALSEALAVRVDTRAVRGIEAASTREALEELAAAGAELV